MVTISFHFSLITLFSLLPHEDRSLFSLFNHQGDKKKKKVHRKMGIFNSGA